MYDTEVSKVAVIRCPNYDEFEVYGAVCRGFELLSRDQTIVEAGERILVKPSILVGDVPDRGTTTHPSVFKQVCRYLLERSAAVYYGDSPSVGGMAINMRRSGISAVAEKLGVVAADFDHGEEIIFHESPHLKRLTIAKGCLSVDGIIGLAKMKTHRFMRVTGAIKNLFGCVPGMLKPQYHVRYPDPDLFARMLVTLNLYLPVRLYATDAIIAMQGNGPRGGEAVPVNALLFSADPVALDATMCRMMNLDPWLVPAIREGSALGLGTADQNAIDIVGDPLGDFVQTDFDVDRSPDISFRRWERVAFLKNALTARPAIDTHRCTRCGICVDICPVRPKALRWETPNGPTDDSEAKRTRPPIFDYNECIRCYCCQEVCPEKAISIVRPWLNRVLFGFG